MKPLQWGPLVLSLLVAPLGAQTAASGSLGTSAAIVAPVAVTANAPLDFGKLTGSQTVTIATDDATSGRFTVTTDPNINVTVSVTPPAAL
jgi:hypothetical protein